MYAVKKDVGMYYLELDVNGSIHGIKITWKLDPSPHNAALPTEQ